ncbi:hypothetical protein JHK82_049207 [Glycine max]|nr:hypothetical protein JHK86_049059 [Glycine max]KAG4934895.1 hypothetical protein JHK85_049814 [Glycine max]KAG5090429.1 hypothetical protein JHK82_049207 [Glycine max]
MAVIPTKAEKKVSYDVKLCQLLEDYTQILVVAADNVGSNQLENIRKDLRGDSDPKYLLWLLLPHLLLILALLQLLPPRRRKRRKNQQKNLTMTWVSRRRRFGVHLD